MQMDSFANNMQQMCHGRQRVLGKARHQHLLVTTGPEANRAEELRTGYLIGMHKNKIQLQLRWKQMQYTLALCEKMIDGLNQNKGKKELKAKEGVNRQSQWPCLWTGVVDMFVWVPQDGVSCVMESCGERSHAELITWSCGSHRV